jgi:fimbrial chaperone protein
MLLLMSSPGLASDFNITPTSLELSSRAKSGIFSVVNSGDEKLNCQIDLKEWSQDEDGGDVYTEARDIVFFPKIMTVEPNEQRAIRIGTKGQPSLKEKTYRLFVEEIPSQKKTTDQKDAGKITAGLTIAFRYSTPIFIKPAQPKESAVIEHVEMSKSVVKARIWNTGNVHVKLLTVTFQGKGADGKELFAKEVAGWYVLQGVARPYEATIPKEVCGALAVVEIAAKSENSTINGTLNVQKTMCAQ